MPVVPDTTSLPDVATGEFERVDFCKLLMPLEEKILETALKERLEDKTFERNVGFRIRDPFPISVTGKALATISGLNVADG